MGFPFFIVCKILKRKKRVNDKENSKNKVEEVFTSTTWEMRRANDGV